MLFLTPNQQCQSTEGKSTDYNKKLQPIIIMFRRNGVGQESVESVPREGMMVGRICQKIVWVFFSWQIPPRD